jgi:hypothetical protein
MIVPIVVSQIAPPSMACLPFGRFGNVVPWCPVPPLKPASACEDD